MESKMTRTSPADYIGELPQKWGTTKVRGLFKERKAKNSDLSEQNLLSLSYGSVIKKDINSKDGLLPDSFSTYNVVEPGDIVFRLTDLQNDKTSLRNGFVKERGIITSAYTTLVPSNACYAEYFNYLFRCYDDEKVFYGLGNGVRQSAGFQELGSLFAPLPPLDTQRKIALLLNKKTALISELVENEKTQIEKLRNYRQALISRLVNGGLSAKVVQKESGADWIGTVPSSWEVVKIKNCTTMRNEKYSFGQFDYLALENIESMTGRYVATETNSSYSLEGSRLAEPLDVIYGKLRPYLAKTFLIEKECCVSSEFAVFSCNKNLTPSYLRYLFLSTGVTEAINSSTYGTKMPRANTFFIRNLLIPLPPVNEQQIITNFLDEKTKEIDELIEIRKEMITALAKYQSALIYSYVMGKKEA
jgi:type I restriction enzyme S subunit